MKLNIICFGLLILVTIVNSFRSYYLSEYVNLVKCRSNKLLTIENTFESSVTVSKLDQNNDNDEISAVKVRKGSQPEFAIEGDSTEETNQQKFTVLMHFIISSINICISINALQSNIDIISLSLTTIISIILGDFATGVFHWSVDNYGDINTPVFGSVCAAFQGHHSTPWTITFRSFANNVYKIAYGTIPALALLSLANVGPYLRLFLTLFINWWLLSQEFHKYSHMRVVPPVMKFLQDNNIILSKKVHGLHHSSPYEGNYCILTGICNPVLDKTNFFRHLEILVFKLTGICIINSLIKFMCNYYLIWSIVLNHLIVGNKPNTWKIDSSIEDYAKSL